MPLQRKRQVEKPESDDLFNHQSPKKSRKRKSSDKNIIQDKSLFGELVNKCGVVLKKNVPNMLECDQVFFQQKLSRSLKTQRQSLNETIKEFISGFEKHIEDLERLKWTLLHCQTSPTCENARTNQQDSLARMLLNIDELQPGIITVLIVQFFVVAYDESEETEENNFPQLILNNLRYLDHVVDHELLTSKVKELLEGSPIQIQRDIIGFIPDILDDRGHETIAKVLLDLYDCQRKLTFVVLDTLPCLSLPSECLSEIHHNVLKTLPSVRAPNIAVVLKFILHHTTKSVAAQVLSDIREKINLPGDTVAAKTSSTQAPSTAAKQSKITEYEDYEKILFVKIKFAIEIFKFLTVEWLKVINLIPDVKEFKSFDFLMLILLYEAVPNRRKAIESIFRNKIRSGLPPNTFLQPLYANHCVILNEHIDYLLSLTGTLMRSSEPVISNFASAMYSFAFLSLESFRWEIVSKILAHIGDTESVKMAALTVLSNLAHKETNLMVKYTVLLKGTLDVIDLLSLREAKKLMDTIIHLAHSDRRQSSLEEELAILVRKQISHTDLKFKRLGVLSAVLTMKNSFEAHSEGDSDTNLGQQEDLFQMVCQTTKKSPLTSALFYDELASNILRNGLHPQIEKLIGDKMTQDFEDSFVVDLDADADADANTSAGLLPLSPQWNLENESDEKAAIAVNFAPMIFCDASGTNLLPSLCPHFRLVRMIESHLNEGDLCNIDALLGCPVVAPEPRIYEKFSSLGRAEQHAALHFIFYVTNWFRELINAFATQKAPELRKKVSGRLRAIVELQNLLSRLLPLCPSYAPPAAVFDFDVSAPSAKVTLPQSASSNKRGRKCKKLIEEEETPSNLLSPVQLESTPATPSQAKPKASGIMDLSHYRPHFRELHLDVFNLLFRSPTFDLDNKEPSLLTLSEVEFLLMDLSAKLSRSFASGTKRTTVLGKSPTERDVGFSNLDLFTYREIAQQSHRFIKPICVHLEKIAAFFQDLVDQNDGVEDAPNMFTERTAYVMKVNTLLFTILKIFFGAPSLANVEHLTILMAALRIIARKIDAEASTQMGKDSLIKIAFRYISKFQNSIYNVETAVAQIHVLEALISLSGDPKPLKVQIAENILRMLQREWCTNEGVREKGAAFSRNIEALLSVLFQHVADPMGCLQELTTDGIQELLEGQGASEKFHTLNKSTLLVYYKCILANLIRSVRKELSVCSTLLEASSAKKKLDLWHSAIKIFSFLVVALKTFSSGAMLSNCFKHSTGFLDLFWQQGMPFLDKRLKIDQNEVIVLIKNLQTSTRILQNACTHTKVKQDLKLVKYVPGVKRSLERILFRVKEMLVVNESLDAFWMGNLKNRDLQGDEILSQQPLSDNEAEDQQDVESDVNLDDEDSKQENTTDYDESV